MCKRIPTPQGFWGPFYCVGAPFRCQLSPIGAIGRKVHITGQVLDCDTGQGINSCIIHLWQSSGVNVTDEKGSEYDYYEPDGRKLELDHDGKPTEEMNTHGRSKHYEFRARCITDENGNYEFYTVIPTPYKDPFFGHWRPPHIHYYVEPLDKNNYDPLVTLLYFENEKYTDTDEDVQSQLVIRLNKKHRETIDKSQKIDYFQGQFDIVLKKKTTDYVKSKL